MNVSSPPAARRSVAAALNPPASLSVRIIVHLPVCPPDWLCLCLSVCLSLRLQPVRQPASVSPPSVCLDKNRPYLPPAKLFTVSQLECSGCNLPGASPGPNCAWCLISGLLIKRNIPSRISLSNRLRLFYWFVGFTEETLIKTETKLTLNTQHVLTCFNVCVTIDDNNV